MSYLLVITVAINHWLVMLVLYSLQVLWSVSGALTAIFFRIMSLLSN